MQPPPENTIYTILAMHLFVNRKYNVIITPLQ